MKIKENQTKIFNAKTPNSQKTMQIKNKYNLKVVKMREK